MLGSIFSTFAINFDKEYIFSNYMLVIWLVIILIVLLIVTGIAAKFFTNKEYNRYIYKYCMAIPNFGFVDYPLAQALMGMTGLLDFMTFSVPVALYVYTVAFRRLTKTGFSPKVFLNSTMKFNYQKSS